MRSERRYHFLLREPSTTLNSRRKRLFKSQGINRRRVFIKTAPYYFSERTKEMRITLYEDQNIPTVIERMFQKCHSRRFLKALTIWYSLFGFSRVSALEVSWPLASTTMRNITPQSFVHALTDLPLIAVRKVQCVGSDAKVWCEDVVSKNEHFLEEENNQRLSHSWTKNPYCTVDHRKKWGSRSYLPRKKLRDKTKISW